MIKDHVWTEQEVKDQQKVLADQLKVSIEEAYRLVDNGELKGKIIEAELHMLRFLLEED